MKKEYVEEYSDKIDAEFERVKSRLQVKGYGGLFAGRGVNIEELDIEYTDEVKLLAVVFYHTGGFDTWMTVNFGDA